MAIEFQKTPRNQFLYGKLNPSRERNNTAKIAIDARPGGPAAKREPSPEGLGLNP
jgi:hypothetical protein